MHQLSSETLALLLLLDLLVIIDCLKQLYLDLGAAYGTAKAGIGIASMGVLKPDLIMKSIVPIVMAGILGIYGLIIAVILLQKSKPTYP